MQSIIDYIKQHVLGSVLVAIGLGILSLAMYIIVEIQTMQTYTAVTDLRLEHIESDISEIKGDIKYIRDNGRTSVERSIDD